MSQAQVECKKKKKKKKPQVKVKSKLLLQLSLRLSAECRMVGQHDDICLESKVEPEQDWVATDNLGKTNSRAGSNTNRTKKNHKGREHILHAYTPDMRVHNKYYLVSTTWSDWVTFSNPNIIQHLISAITLDLWVWIGIASGNLVVAHIKVREREMKESTHLQVKVKDRVRQRKRLEFPRDVTLWSDSYRVEKTFRREKKLIGLELKPKPKQEGKLLQTMI